MCKHCDKVVIDMGVLESDLPYLKFRTVFWECAVPGCCLGTRMKDYDLLPFFWWNVKVVREDVRWQHRWRGGWTDVSNHYYLCGKHWDGVSGRIASGRIVAEQVEANPNYLLERIKDKKNGKSIINDIQKE